MVFKLVRKTMFEQTYNFCVIMWRFFSLYLINVYNEKVILFCFVFLNSHHLTFLLVNSNLLREDLATSAT